MRARFWLVVAVCLSAGGCVSLPTSRNTGLLTISIEGEAHEIQTFKPIRPRLSARPFLVIRASDVAVLRPPGRYWLHLVPGSAARNYLVLALGYKGEGAVGDALILPPHLDRISGGPYSMEDRWEWHFYVIADDGRLRTLQQPIQ
jgi:hypothetical protein